MSELRHRQVVVNGVELHYVEAGAGPLVLLLHGFPDYWYSWHLQIPVLAAAGFHVVAPDLRGYNRSAKPAGIHQYRIELLAEDIVSLVHVVGEQRSVVVGHDWGGVIGWKIAHDSPEVVRQLIILNAPHPVLFRQALRNFWQVRKSWYLFFFQLPWMPEAAIRACDYAALRYVLRAGAGSTPAFSEDEVLAYKAALAQPGALTAALNYYRAAVRFLWREGLVVTKTVTQPTLVIWGERDPYLDLRLLRGLERWVSCLRIERIPDAGHWVHIEAQDRVNDMLLRFLKEDNCFRC